MVLMASQHKQNQLIVKVGVPGWLFKEILTRTGRSSYKCADIQKVLLGSLLRVEDSGFEKATVEWTQ